MTTPTPRRRPRRLSPRTLRGKLIVSFVSVLLVAATVIAAATAIFLHSYLVNRLDQQLAQAGGRYSASLSRGHEQGGHSGDDDGSSAVPGQGAGTLSVELVNNDIAQATVVSTQGIDKGVELTTSDRQAMTALVAGSGPHSISLQSVGSYRLQAVSGRAGTIEITGLPLGPVTDTLRRLAAVEAGVLIGVIAIGGLVAILMVRRTLRPLARVTNTAHEVAQLPLTAADTDIPRSAAPNNPVSEVEHMDAAFAHMLDHVHNALSERDDTERRLRQFIADASHELRTPLATIRAHAEFLTGPNADAAGDPWHERSAALRSIGSAADRMGRLVADLLLLARLDAGRPLERRHVDLTRLALDTVGDLRVSHPDHHWRLDLTGYVIAVTGDEQRLQQVLTNLLSNAAVHTPAGTTVTTRLWISGSTVSLEVIDNGPGIPRRSDRRAIRPFHPRGQLPVAGARQHRARPRNRPRHRLGARRHPRPRFPARPRKHLSSDAPRSEGGGACLRRDRDPSEREALLVKLTRRQPALA